MYQSTSERFWPPYYAEMISRDAVHQSSAVREIVSTNCSLPHLQRSQSPYIHIWRASGTPVSQNNSPATVQADLPRHVTPLIIAEAVKNKRRCCISLDVDDISAENACVTTCGQVFSNEHISRWMQKHSTCPECRQQCRINGRRSFSSAQTPIQLPPRMPSYSELAFSCQSVQTSRRYVSVDWLQNREDDADEYESFSSDYCYSGIALYSDDDDFLQCNCNSGDME